MSNLQSRIKKVRTEHGMSVEDVAKKLAENGVKISARTIYSYELNERQPSVMYLQALTNSKLGPKNGGLTLYTSFL